jgi:hypothetical protein
MKLSRAALPIGITVLALVACNRREDRTSETNTTGESVTTTKNDRPTREHVSDRSGTTTTTGATYGSVSYESATNRIVASRCDREVACDNIGAKKRFADRTVCTHELGAKLRDDLKPSECPNGVDAKNLDDCLSAIQKESCGNIIDTISRIGACNTSGLCLKADEQPHR